MILLGDGRTFCLYVTPPQGSFLQGSRFRPGEWLDESSGRRGIVEKRSDVWDLAVVRLICSVLWSLLLPSPWCCSQKCSAKNPLVAMAPQAPAWLTLCHIILWQRWWRECWGVILGSSWGLAHKHRQTHTHTYAHVPAQIRVCTHIYSRRKHTLRGPNTL